ncbi:putative membrane protein YccC [Paraburkholderia caballeronis]|uniref:FUSC family protein n=1 Tax=Paraburkholderia caballeronis TaxID=416943 RepID=UPI001065CFFF|nr:FUSC family protein [Paraburkholderia caballeronis]TDV26790.1 putative membrane protein YccC [Paraburkholderia caballeronis]
MNRQQAINRTFDSRRRVESLWRATRRAVRDWQGTDGAVWLHLLKTVTACLMAMGIAMLLDLPQPRIAMTTVFVLMQPLSGMVFAKSVYRIVGTGVGMVAAVVLGAVFVQQPELYILGITAWVAACTAAAMRNRHFRWYGFVLAGYTAALIGIPVVTQPNGLFLAALGRGAEVAIGILCSGIVSAVIMPRQSGSLLTQTLRMRFRDFTAFAAGVLAGGVERRAFEGRFASLVDEIVGFEATRAYSFFEDPILRSRSQHLARLNDEFMHACARLHALRQLLKRLRWDNAAIQPLAPYFNALSTLLAQRPYPDETDRAYATRIARALHTFQCTLPRSVRETRRPLENASPDALQDFDTSAELLYRFTTEVIQYSETYAALTLPTVARASRATRYVARTNWYVVAFTFVRTAVVMAAIGWFWIETDWPSGGLAMIAAALTCALTSSTPNATRMAVQMAVGAIFGSSVGYLFSCYVYPNVDGFLLLCAVLVPVLAPGAFLAARRGVSGYGIGFSVFFCLLAGPDNVIVYAPDLLINNGIAIVAAMLVAALAFAIVFPPHMGWLIERMCVDLRGQVVLACTGNLDGLGQRFQSGTHDLMHQLRLLLSGRISAHRRALRWMLVALEVGHAVIDLRREAAHARYIGTLDDRWPACVERVLADIATLFSRPDRRQLDRALVSVRAATWVAQQVLDAVHTDRGRRHDLQRLLSYLHFIRSALLDRDAPLGAISRSGPRSRAH